MPTFKTRTLNIANGPADKGGDSSASHSQGDTSSPAATQKVMIVERVNESLAKAQIGEGERSGPSIIENGMLPVVNKGVRKTGAI